MHMLAASSCPVTPKSVPPKVGPARPILAENFAKIGPQTTFAAKIGPARPILAAKTGPPLSILVPPVKINLQQFNYIAS